MKNKYILTALLVSALLFVGIVPFADAEGANSQLITLAPGWNIISTPRVVESHQFSAPETSGNFSIFVLNVDDPSGWSTMASLSQSEFTPLYGYFVHNNTGTSQTLILHYKGNLSPNERLFERKFTKPGWYSIGVANPTYAKPQGGSGADANNVDKILDSLADKISSIIDFTDANSNPDSVVLADPWLGVVVSQMNTLKDLRELKGYAIYIDEESALLNGFQNTGEPVSITPSLTIEPLVLSDSNVGVEVANQTLGAFTTRVVGEDVRVNEADFIVNITNTSGSTADISEITDITLVNNIGVVVAGPIDGSSASNDLLTFTDVITFKNGTETYFIKGRLSNALQNGDQIQISIHPSQNWVPAKDTFDREIPVQPTSIVQLGSMSVRRASLRVSLSADTNSSNPNVAVVRGTSAYPFTKYILDASESGEDVRVTSMRLNLATSYPANTADEMTNCQLFGGNTALNTGTNIVNPSNNVAAGDDITFTLDGGLVISKGTIKTLALKCNIVVGGTAERMGWGLTDSASTVVSTGVTSGQAINEFVIPDSGRTIVAQTSGALTLSLDSASPSLKLVQAGATDQTLAVFRLDAVREDIRLEQLGLQLGNIELNNPSDLRKVTLWDGVTKVGEVVFTSDYATATLTGFTVLKDSSKLLTVKADIAPVNVNLSEAIPGHLVSIDYDAGWGNASDDDTNEGRQGGSAVGMSSGTTIYTGGNDTTSNGARIVKAIPTLTKLSTSGKFTNTTDQILYRFKIDAPAGTNGVSLYKFTFNVSTSTQAVDEYTGSADAETPSAVFKATNFRVYCFSDAAFSQGSCGNSTGLLNQYGLAIADGTNVDFEDGATTADPDVDIAVLFNPTASSGATAAPITISEGTTRYFQLVADVTGASSTPNIATKLLGDAGWISSIEINNPDLVTANEVNQSVDNDLIWSDNAISTTPLVNSSDWLNGYLVSGLPSVSTGSETLSF